MAFSLAAFTAMRSFMPAIAGCGLLRAVQDERGRSAVLSDDW